MIGQTISHYQISSRSDGLRRNVDPDALRLRSHAEHENEK